MTYTLTINTTLGMIDGFHGMGACSKGLSFCEVKVCVLLGTFPLCGRESLDRSPVNSLRLAESEDCFRTSETNFKVPQSNVSNQATGRHRHILFSSQFVSLFFRHLLYFHTVEWAYQAPLLSRSGTIIRTERPTSWEDSWSALGGEV